MQSQTTKFFYFLGMVSCLLDFRPVSAQVVELTTLPDANAKVAAYTQDDLTAQDLVIGLKLLRVRGTVKWDTLHTFPHRTLKMAAELIASNRLLTEQSHKEQAWAPPATIAAELERMKGDLLVQTLFEEVILSQLKEPTEEQLRARYEKDSDIYRIPFRFSMRHIFLSTYIEHTVKAGDTLEEIAKRYLENPKDLHRILSKQTKRPRAEDPESPQKMPIKELVEGEILMIPKPEKETAEIQKRIETIHAALQKGQDFEKLARENSEFGNMGEVIDVMPAKDRPMLDVFTAAVKETPIGSFSKPFRTKHGWQIIQVVRRTDEGMRPFKDLKDQIAQQWSMEHRKEFIDEFVENAFIRSNLIKVHPDALKPTALPEDVVAEVGAKKYNRQSFLMDFPKEEYEKLPETSVRRLIATVARLWNPVLLERAKEMGMAESPDFLGHLQRVEEYMIAEAYLSHLLKQSLGDPAEDALRKHYEENLKSGFQTPRQLDLYVMAKRPVVEGVANAKAKKAATEALLVAMNDIKSQIKDLLSFKKMAVIHSEIQTEKGGFVGRVTTQYSGGLGGV